MKPPAIIHLTSAPGELQHKDMTIEVIPQQQILLIQRQHRLVVSITGHSYSNNNVLIRIMMNNRPLIAGRHCQAPGFSVAIPVCFLGEVEIRYWPITSEDRYSLNGRYGAFSAPSATRFSVPYIGEIRHHPTGSATNQVRYVGRNLAEAQRSLYWRG